MLFFHPMDFLIIIAFGIALWAQFRVKGTFRRWSNVHASRGLTGREAARRLLDNNGLYDVQVEPVRGYLSDHYDPRTRTVRLSEPVYNERSISAISVACHEVGHAIQHAENYSMLTIRSAMFPLVNFSSSIAPLLIIAGLFFQQFNFLLGVGIIFFAAVVAFQLITLPVEFNASNRARELMVAEGFIANDEERGVAKVLNAAALTYVAAALVSALELIKYIMIANSRD